MASVHEGDTALASHRLALRPTGWQSSALGQITQSVPAARPQGTNPCGSISASPGSNVRKVSPHPLKKSWKVYTQMCKRST